jgi:GAF domain-containing protein
MTEDRFTAAVAAEVVAAAHARAALLQSIADVARAIFSARAASIAMLDEAAGEFRFEAVSGEGATELVGVRFPATQGYAGIVAQTGEAIVADDLTGDPRMARNVGERTGYVPQAMIVAPLLHDEDTLGVLWILDRERGGRTGLQELELVGAFARQAAMALALGNAAERATVLLAGGEAGEGAGVARLARRIAGLDEDRRAAATALIAALDTLLA